jgi:glycerate kinase
VRVVIAPDKFAGTLSAADAAAAMAQGWASRRPDDELVLLPMADGGAGTLEVVAALGGTRHDAVVADARGHAITAQWLELPDGRALVESAQACGLDRLNPDLRSPRLATTYGVGQLIQAAIDHGVTKIIVGVGGTATVDGGGGMASALGHRLLREDGNGVKVGGEFLTTLHRITPRAPLPISLRAAVDVDAPLLGPDGAVTGFAEQKGAPPEDLPLLETALQRIADVAEHDLPGGPWRDLPGAGAGGGLGFGLAAFAGAELIQGVALVADLVALHEKAAGADVLITGEGRVDRWSLRGKVAGAVLEVGRRTNARVMVIAGQIDEAGAAFDNIAELGPQGLHDAARLIAEHAAQLADSVSQGS